MRRVSVFFSTSIFLGVLILLMNACYKAPEFANEPAISFNNVTFNRGVSEFDPDSLVLTLNFRDGDGDLGLRSEGSDTGQPYNDIWYFINQVNGKLLRYSDRNLPEYDTLPPYEFPYYCQNYTISEDFEEPFEIDTFYIEPNEFHHNIKIKYFTKKNGAYTEFNFETAFDPLCGETFNGRFPLLNSVGRDRALEGTLKYKMQSAGFELLFRQDTIMLEVYIYDRALNKSNVVNTPDFVLRDITIGG